MRLHILPHSQIIDQPEHNVLTVAWFKRGALRAKTLQKKTVHKLQWSFYLVWRISDIRHPTSTYVIPILERNMSDWKTSFRYRNYSDNDIRVHSDIRHWRKKLYHFADLNPQFMDRLASAITLGYCDCLCQTRMSDIWYRKKLYSDIRYNIGLRSLSPISEVPISGLVRYRWSRISD
jgi:hypothetical protein